MNVPTPDALLHFATTDEAEGRRRLAVTGEIDAHTAERLTHAVESAVADGTVRDLVVDLTGVAFVDSSGLRALVDARVRTQDRQVGFLLDGTSAPVRRLLEVSGMAQVFE